MYRDFQRDFFKTGIALHVRYFKNFWDIQSIYFINKQRYLALWRQTLFSITINHVNTYTGITDYDRALTISSLAKICKELQSEEDNNKIMMIEEFQNNFRTPGHVPILIASKGLLNERKGHTEMSVLLTKIANITNVTTICEMLDPNNYKALSVRRCL